MRGNLVSKSDGNILLGDVHFVPAENGDYELTNDGRIMQHQNNYVAQSIDFGESQQPTKSEHNHEYTITAFRSRPLQELWLPHRGDVRRGWSRRGSETVPYTYDEIINNNLYEIYSVKRLSDSQEFTVDEITEQGKIIEFNASDVPFNVHCSQGHYKLSALTKKKEKQILFTTDDGVKVYHDQKYLVVDTTDKHSKPCDVIADNKLHGDYLNVTYPTNKRFSTKEKAEEYIIFNKPLFSVNDIMENSREKVRGEWRGFYDLDIAKFMSIAKEKIKL